MTRGMAAEEIRRLRSDVAALKTRWAVRSAQQEPEQSTQAGVAAGEAAQRAFLEIRDAKTSVVRKVELEEGLRRVCERDTWGLVVLRRLLCGE